jgi:hypothetical protein
MFRNELRWALVLATVFLGAEPAHGETAIQVSVDCTVRGMTQKYGPEKLLRSLDKLRFLLVQDLQGAGQQVRKWPDLAYWNFVQGSSMASQPQNKESVTPHLQFLIFKSKAGPVMVKMEYLSPLDPTAEGSWEEPWMARGKPGSFGYPDEEDALVGNLLEFIHKSLIKTYLEPLRQALVASAPLAEGGNWNPKVDSHVVLPLRWDRYYQLSQREFRLACQRGAKTDSSGKDPQRGTGADELELLSCGTGQYATYADNIPPYPAVAVAPKAWRRLRGEIGMPLTQIRADGRKLQLLRAYLDEDKWNLCSSQGMEIIQGREVKP